MTKTITITLTLAEARALRGRALAGLDEAWYEDTDGTPSLLIPRPTYDAAERAIKALDAALGKKRAQ